MMSDKRKSRLEIALFAAAGAVLFAFAIVGVRVVGERQALHKTEELLGYACTDVPDTLRGNLYFVQVLEGEVAASRINVTNPPPPAEMRKIIDSTSLDELYLVNKYGKVVAAAEPEVLGLDLSTKPSMAEFLSLVDSPELIIEQPIRISIANPNLEVSYAGFPQPNGSLIICGYTVDHLRRNFIASGADLMSTWEVGENGGYVIVDENGRMIFAIDGVAKAGDRFTDFGDPKALSVDFDSYTTHIGFISGVKCHYRVFECYGIRMIAYFPHDEFFAPVKLMTAAVAVVLLLVFVVFGVVFHRVTVANRAIAKMREAEDRQRLKDMVMATSIQKHSLPTTFPPYPNHVNDFDIYSFMQTAKEVGGDFYDFYFVGKNRIAMVIADVSGKGVPAAMFMMRAKTTLQGLLKGGMELTEAMSKANDRLCEGNLEDMFVTAWIGICDLTTGEVEYVNAGHNPPIIRRNDGSVKWLVQRSGLVLAAMPGATYRIHKVTLEPGDGLVLYTDGVTEAQDTSGSLYGEDRLECATRDVGMDLDACAYCNAILASIGEFAGEADQADDITMLAFRLKRLAPPVAKPVA